MAINFNIQSGNSPKVAKTNVTSASKRAAQAKSGLTGPAEVSNSGMTAVKSSGILGKIKNLVGKGAGIASKFLPGLAGTVAKGIGNLFNDPEWWQSVAGDALTLNQALMISPITTILKTTGGKNPETIGNAGQFKSAIAEFASLTVYDGTESVIDPSPNMITQYLMPQVRKVVNAIPLQEANAYTAVLKSHATLYALWRTLRKYDYMLKHGTTYLPNMNVDAYPAFQVSNAAWLQSTINRLEEYLRANVRLPHTLCEYLAWRYGRVYKSNNSAKAGIILYNVVPITFEIQSYDELIAGLMAVISGTPANQLANTDLYNAYYDHDQMVEIRDDTQFVFDAKEFMLRTNADIGKFESSIGNSDYTETTNPIVIDSSLDNPTAFMASTVSTRGTDASSGATGSTVCLFPIQRLSIYYYVTDIKDEHTILYLDSKAGGSNSAPAMSRLGTTNWFRAILVTSVAESNASFAVVMVRSVLCKALDLYNKGQYAMLTGAISESAQKNGIYFVDLTALSIDTGVVTDAVIGIEQTYAFANLVHVDRKSSMTYAQAEKLVAKDVANTIENTDVSVVKTV